MHQAKAGVEASAQLAPTAEKKRRRNFIDPLRGKFSFIYTHMHFFCYIHTYIIIYCRYIELLYSRFISSELNYPVLNPINSTLSDLSDRQHMCTFLIYWIWKLILICHFKVLVKAVHWLCPEFAFMWLVDEAKKNMPLELDFLREGHNSEKVANMLAHFPFLKVHTRVQFKDFYQATSYT